MPRSIEYNLKDLLAELGESQHTVTQRTQEILELEQRVNLVLEELHKVRADHVRLDDLIFQQGEIISALSDRCKRLEFANG